MMRVTKKISQQGSITLPKSIRAELGIPKGTAVDVTTDGDYIIIGKHTPLCHFCGSPDKVFTALGIEICAGCAQKIYEKAGVKNGR